MTLDETDIERISPTIRRTEVRIVSTPPHSWVRFVVLVLGSVTFHFFHGSLRMFLTSYQQPLLLLAFSFSID